MPEIEINSQGSDRWNAYGNQFIGSSADAVNSMINTEGTQTQLEPFFGAHIREGIAIVRDWIRNP